MVLPMPIMSAKVWSMWACGAGSIMPPAQMAILCPSPLEVSMATGCPLQFQ